MKKFINFISSPALTNILLIALLVMLIYGYDLLTDFNGNIKVSDNEVNSNINTMSFNVDKQIDKINDNLESIISELEY